MNIPVLKKLSQFSKPESTTDVAQSPNNFGVTSNATPLSDFSSPCSDFSGQQASIFDKTNTPNRPQSSLLLDCVVEKSESEKTQKQKLQENQEEEKSLPPIKSPIRRREKMRRNMMKTLNLSFHKSASGMVKDIQGNLIPEKIANYAENRVTEATMEGYADIDNTFDNKYELLEIIGEGTTGLVRKCINKLTKEIRAVKIIRTNEIEILKAVKTEFLIQKELDHPNIVKVYEMFYNPITSRLQIIMEFIEGTELFETICKNGPLTGIFHDIKTRYCIEMTAKVIFKELLEAIQYMHYKGVCHRDLKPHNILLTAGGNQLKVTDFNVSKYFAKKLGESKEIIKMSTHTGTIAYNAPETFTKEEYTYFYFSNME